MPNVIGSVSGGCPVSKVSVGVLNEESMYADLLLGDAVPLRRGSHEELNGSASEHLRQRISIRHRDLCKCEAAGRPTRTDDRRPVFHRRVIESSSAYPVPPAKFGDPFASRITFDPARSCTFVCTVPDGFPQAPVVGYDTVWNALLL